MAQKNAKKRSKKQGKVEDLPGKSLKPKEAEGVKGGAKISKSQLIK